LAKNYAVVGGGFQGLISAYLLAEKGMQVFLIEKAPVLGGIMYSWDWKGFSIDKGVHLFDSIPKNLGDIVTDVMRGKVLPINFNYGSVYQGVTTPGLAIPDLSNLDTETRSKILYELVEAATRTEKEKFNSLYELLQYNYGSTAADILDATMNHIYRISTKNVEQDSVNQTAYHRLRFLSDEMSLELKKNPTLDKRIAARRRAMGKVDDFVSLYPGVGGMKGFVEHMTERLNAMGVKVLTGQSVERIKLLGKGVELKLTSGDRMEVDHLAWTQDYATLADVWTGEGAVYKEKVHSTPMVLYYFCVQAKYVNDYTYFHQFTPGSLIFRSAAAGLYSGQIKKDGMTFISAECPTNVGSDLWNQPEKYIEGVWQECIAMDLLKTDAVKGPEVKIMKAPITHKFNKVGMLSLMDDFNTKIDNTNLAIVKPGRNAFTRREIMWSVEEMVQKLTQ
jgi:hypothetical protein